MNLNTISLNCSVGQLLFKFKGFICFNTENQIGGECRRYSKLSLRNVCKIGERSGRDRERDREGKKREEERAHDRVGELCCKHLGLMD